MNKGRCWDWWWRVIWLITVTVRYRYWSGRSVATFIFVTSPEYSSQRSQWDWNWPEPKYNFNIYISIQPCLMLCLAETDWGQESRFCLKPTNKNTETRTEPSTNSLVCFLISNTTLPVSHLHRAEVIIRSIWQGTTTTKEPPPPSQPPSPIAIASTRKQRNEKIKSDQGMTSAPWNKNVSLKPSKRCLESILSPPDKEWLQCRDRDEAGNCRGRNVMKQQEVCRGVKEKAARRRRW